MKELLESLTLPWGMTVESHTDHNGPRVEFQTWDKSPVAMVNQSGDNFAMLIYFPDESGEPSKIPQHQGYFGSIYMAVQAVARLLPYIY